MNFRLMEAVRRYEIAIDRKAPITPEQLYDEYPDIRTELVEYFSAKSVIAPESTDLDPQEFELLDTPRYCNIRHYKSGGMGALSRALDTNLSREVAIKVPLKATAKNPSQLERMKREAYLSSQLQHPNIPPVFEGGEIETTSQVKVPYFAMRLVEGANLEELLKDSQYVRENQMQFILIFLQVCRAVAYAHSKGIANRDLKPQNIIVGVHDDVYVVDWGNAKEFTVASRQGQEPQSFNPTTSTFNSNDAFVHSTDVGTPSYVAPEVVQRRPLIDPCRIDVFGLGGILCKILTGRAVYFRQESDLSSMIGDVEPALRRLRQSGASRELISLATRCLAVDPADRPANGAEVQTMVATFLGNQEKKKLAAEKRLRYFITGFGISALLLVGGLYNLRVKRVKAEQVSVHNQAGMRAYAAGKLRDAENEFIAAEQLGQSTDEWIAKRLRAGVTQHVRTKSLQELDLLLAKPMLPSARAELLWLRGDLRACEGGQTHDYQTDLQEALNSGLLSKADTAYAQALLAEDIAQCDRHLAAALEAEPLHPRAAVLRPAVLLAMGRMQEAGQMAVAFQLVFEQSMELAAVRASCQEIRNTKAELAGLPEQFQAALKQLVGSFDAAGTEAASGPAQLTFNSQAHVAKCAGKLMEALPNLSDAPGLPKHIFQKRASLWNRLGRTIGEFMAPQTVLDQLLSVTFNREKAIQELERVASGESDALIQQMIASARFAYAADHFSDWFKDDQSRLKTELQQIVSIQTLAIERETLAPRSQFEIASRIARMVSNFMLAQLLGDKRDERTQAIEQDTDDLLSKLDQFPEFIDRACDVMLDLYRQAPKADDDLSRGDELGQRLKIANFWVKRRPDNERARMYRARIWLLLKQPDLTLADLQNVAQDSPLAPNVQSMRREAEAMQDTK